MSGIMKLMATFVVLVVAGLATLLVFDIISLDTFGSGAGKAVLLAAIVVLAGLALGLIMKGNGKE